ncbi:uncharacterized protein MYCFIDRAFT_65237 [Pseudocercospora fijiensis CIRAD86]|uniref:Alpha/beta hydrolase fold-3 domain-containing protein n=1 Tax=Pseudocercospora fijiensis (strain CIRAD86) TaxID=383855 RepID=M2YWV5_PSEFD|nr:uncharacterized protein MYCFIDRAFT_65237 [Pseudocercospora fijiensis CIRAD86]EME82190.1 hypothetical protein MYCFIDRAFT_65237 [Pseudocercospora fijiensis CIRAD86]
MPLTSDLNLDHKKFDPSQISDQTKKYNDQLIEVQKKGPKWYEVGAETHRRMRWEGKTPFPAPQVLSDGINSTAPSRDPDRSIPIRIFQAPKSPASGIFYHIHGGGWVLQSEHYQDLMLKRYSEEANLTIVSVGYRLAPECPFPKGNEDCVDVGEWLVDRGEEEFGAPLKFMGGDSAGGHLSVVTCFSLLETRPNFAFKGLVLNFGAYELSTFLPACHAFDMELLAVWLIVVRYIEAYLPNTTEKDRRDPKISPFWKDLMGLKLPPALFTCGTLDPLLDDSLLMSAKWAASGADSILKIYPGAPHGFSFFPVGGTEQTDICLKDIGMFMNERL